jgi:uncharacterized Zn finger protein
MTATNRLRFDFDVLRELAGEKMFARGVAYHREGLVEILLIDPGRVLAQVRGTDDYRVEITGQGEHFGGECSCPAFGDWGFCKHLVATALAVNDQPAAEVDGAGALTRIRDHLKNKGVDALVELVLDVATRDPALFRKLDMAAAAVHDDDKTLRKRLRKAIDGATRIKGFVDYREASGWAAGVESVLDSIAPLASGARSGLAIELAEHAIDRISRAIQSIDDSDGNGSALLAQARDIHVAATLQARPEPVQLARSLFAREMRDDYGTFDMAAALYAEALGEAGLAEYRSLATEAWETSPSGKNGRTQQESSANRGRLEPILDFFAERAGDVDARIALRAKDLSAQWRYLQLAEFCRSQGRADEALRRAEEGLWMFEDEVPDERLVLLAADLMSKVGRDAEAVAHLQRVFERDPGFELYQRLGEYGGEVARERALKFLEAGLPARKPTGWSGAADLLIRIRMHEKNFDAAWSVVRKQGASMGLKEELARACDTTHPALALEVYAERVDQLVNSGTGYAEAADLVTRMATLRSKGEQVAYVHALKERFGRKRNFMKLLP